MMDPMPAPKVPKLNRPWHLAHRMPERATGEQRIRWHLEHAKHCGCRPIPTRLQSEIKQRRLA